MLHQQGSHPLVRRAASGAGVPHEGHLAAVAAVGIAYHALQFRWHLVAGEARPVEPTRCETSIGHKQ